MGIENKNMATWAHARALFNVAVAMALFYTLIALERLNMIEVLVWLWCKQIVLPLEVTSAGFYHGALWSLVGEDVAWTRKLSADGNIISLQAERPLESGEKPN